jgi:DNA-directed RNA polymerase subunit RPC12/RpoP
MEYALKKCLVCGASIPVNIEKSLVECKFCGSQYEVKRLNGKPSQEFWLGFGVATILWLIAVPIISPAVTKWLEKKVA